MVTLTYPNEYPHDGALVKYHLKRFLQEIRRAAISSGRKDSYSSFWFLEFQERGAPHFHVLTTEFIRKDELAQLWYGIVASGDEKHLKAGTSVEKLRLGRKGMISYAKKYALKSCQKVVPDHYQNVGRFWGVSGVKTVTAADVTFFADSCEKAQINEEKSKIIDIVEQMLHFRAAKLIKTDFNFRMFHVEQSHWLFGVLMGQIRYSNTVIEEHDSLFCDADLDCEYQCWDTKRGVELFGGDVYRYKKWGEF